MTMLDMVLLLCMVLLPLLYTKAAQISVTGSQKLFGRRALFKLRGVCYTVVMLKFLPQGAFALCPNNVCFFITTGGTIASVRTQQGLKPVLSSEECLRICRN